MAAASDCNSDLQTIAALHAPPYAAHSMASPLISAGEVQWITAGVSFNIRNDGRQREDFRTLSVQLGVIAQATGSARVQLGETDVIAGVKVRVKAVEEEAPRREPPGLPPLPPLPPPPAAAAACQPHLARSLPACHPQAEIGSPDPDRPDCGRLVFGVECSPVASPAFRVRS